VTRKAGLVACGVLAVGAVAGAVVLLTRGGKEKPATISVRAVRPPPVLRAVHEFGARVPSGRRLTLRASPGGPVLTTVGARTEFGSPQTFSVAYAKGPWLAVRSTALGNTQLGWVRMRRVRLLNRTLSLEVDLSKRELLVRNGGILRRISVAVGSPDTPTPPGTFFVTDKLRGADFGSYYGCCILALSGRQPDLPQGWSGGDRLAIHGSPVPTWGHAVSNGCLHAEEADLHYLMKTVPLGTAVRIHA
jgi:lipoprotein-anchoring transpeptidase ErfK/SrfK